MPSPQPSADNDYFFSDDTRLDVETLNGIFSSIAARIAAQEAKVADYVAAINILTAQGLDIIAANLAPALVDARADLTTLQADLETLADEIASIRAGGIDAASVTMAAISGLTATNAQAAVAELLNRLGDNEEAVLAALAAIASVSYAATRPSIVTAVSVTAVAGQRIKCNTAAGAITVTLPLAPADGATVSIARNGAHAVTIARNGQPIGGVAADFVLNADKVGVDLEHADGGWMVRPWSFAA